MSKEIIEFLTQWLREQVIAAKAEGLIIGVSGGIDSAVAAGLAKRAFPDRCLGVIMPCQSHRSDVQDAVKVMETLDMRYHILPLDHCYETFMKTMRAYPEHAMTASGERMAMANIKPRLRMTTLYYMAGMSNYLVLGTSNKCEIAVGYATKWGDNAVDLQVLGDLYKSEVYDLARELGIPLPVIDKAPSAGLWEGQTDEAEMGFTYELLEHYLKTGEGPPETVARIQEMNRASAHKRTPPPIPRITDIRS